MKVLMEIRDNTLCLRVKIQTIFMYLSPNSMQNCEKPKATCSCPETFHCVAQRSVQLEQPPANLKQFPLLQ